VEPAHGLPAGTARGAQACTGVVTALRACVAAWPAVALPWVRWGARTSTAEGSPTRQVGEGGSSSELLADGKGGKPGRWRRSPMRWVLRWPAWSCIGVGRKRELRRRCTQRKRRQGGARGSAHCGVGHDGGGGRSSGDGAAPRGELLHRRGEGGEGRQPASE
jgi:hypothetical protein